MRSIGNHLKNRTWIAISKQPPPINGDNRSPILANFQQNPPSPSRSAWAGLAGSRGCRYNRLLQKKGRESNMLAMGWPTVSSNVNGCNSHGCAFRHRSTQKCCNQKYNSTLLALPFHHQKSLVVALASMYMYIWRVTGLLADSKSQKLHSCLRICLDQN